MYLSIILGDCFVLNLAPIQSDSVSVQCVTQTSEGEGKGEGEGEGKGEGEEGGRKHPVKIKVEKLQIIKLLTQGQLYMHVSFTSNSFPGRAF